MTTIGVIDINPRAARAVANDAADSRDYPAGLLGGAGEVGKKKGEK